MQISKHIIEQRGLLAPRESTPARVSIPQNGLRWRALLLAVVCALAHASLSHAQQPEFTDQGPEIKATYLYNFGRYVEWPGEAPKDFVIGVVGNSPVVSHLNKIAESKKVNERAIVVRRFNSEKDFQKCQMLFVPAGQDPKVSAALLKKARETATLIVGEDKDFALKQGHIGFYADQNNIKIEINSGAAQKAELKISSKLMKVGRIVDKKPAK